VSLQYLDGFVDSLVEEIKQKGEINPCRSLNTLYLGGGTPSLLSAMHLDKILNAIHSYHSFRENPEWTIECNPDDLDQAMLRKLNVLGFNRLSIGIQSFHERDLKIMRRSHNAEQADKAISLAASSGFENISIDLIYGIPGQPPETWEHNLELALSLPISHLSAYHLTFEPGTVFDHWRKKGRLLPVTEEVSINQFRILREKLLPAGFDHYELSNFASKGKRSEHNMLYWSGLPYLGLGPSAHSFDGNRRSWNVSSIKGYMERVAAGEETGESEHLSTREKYHDYLITSLRTRWGADPEFIEKSFGIRYRTHFENQAQKFINTGSMYQDDGLWVIDPRKWMITDHVLRSLFMD
jgi:oxygen-independent coproporphyrinogen-3 oxidase